MTWATSVPILFFLGLSVLDLGPMYATDVRQYHCLMAPPRRRGHNKAIAEMTFKSLTVICQQYDTTDTRQACDFQSLHALH